MSIKRLYRALLCLYPRDYAAAFAGEMLAAFEQAYADRRLHGRSALVRFASRELSGLAIGIATEWIARLTTDSSIRGRSLPDLRKMRPVGIPAELWFTGAGANLNQSALPLEVAQAQDHVTSLVNRMVHAIATHDYLAARTYSYEESRERDRLHALRKKHGLDQ